MNISVDLEGTFHPGPGLKEVVGVPAFILFTLYDYIMLLLGVFGNMLILCASIKFNAINLDQVSLIFIRNIAIVDILWTIITTLTISVSNTCSNTWCLGKAICVLVGYMRHCFAATEILLICLCSVHRIFTIMMALRAHVVTSKHAYIGTILSWVLPALIITSVSLYYSIDVGFDPMLSTCVSSIHNTPRAKRAVVLMTLVLVIIPFIITIVSNLCMLYYAIRLAKKQPDTKIKTAFVTVFAICGTFVITSLPNMVRLLLPPLGTTSPAALEIVNSHVYLINASCNSIILAATNRKFRTFIFKRFLRCFYSQETDESLFNCSQPYRTRASVLTLRNSSSAELFARRCSAELSVQRRCSELSDKKLVISEHDINLTKIVEIENTEH